MAQFDDLIEFLRNVEGESLNLSSDEIMSECDLDELPETYFKGNNPFTKNKALTKAIAKGGYVIEDIVSFDKSDKSFMLALKRDETLLVEEERGIKFNKDLPIEEIEFYESESGEKEIVKINKANAATIHRIVTEHHRYKYTQFIKIVFERTKKDNPKDLTVDDVVARLVCIDNIDGTNLSKSSVKESYAAFAQSILDVDLESYIKDGKTITDKIFQKIAIREPIASRGKQKRFFSAISKYIARTAYYCYEKSDGYPIYDEVLRKHLYLYIPEFTPSEVSKVKEECKYERYCKTIKKYLDEINKGLVGDQRITNLEFDQIVWFSYKTANAEPKYK